MAHMIEFVSRRLQCLNEWNWNWKLLSPSLYIAVKWFHLVGRRASSEREIAIFTTLISPHASTWSEKSEFSWSRHTHTPNGVFWWSTCHDYGSSATTFSHQIRLVHRMIPPLNDDEVDSSRNEWMSKLAASSHFTPTKLLCAVLAHSLYDYLFAVTIFLLNTEWCRLLPPSHSPLHV